MKEETIYFKIKDDITFQELVDIIQNAWPHGMTHSVYGKLKSETRRHLVIKNRSRFCKQEDCYGVVDIDNVCTRDDCPSNVNQDRGNHESKSK